MSLKNPNRFVRGLTDVSKVDFVDRTQARESNRVIVVRDKKEVIKIGPDERITPVDRFEKPSTGNGS